MKLRSSTSRLQTLIHSEVPAPAGQASAHPTPWHPHFPPLQQKLSRRIEVTNSSNPRPACCQANAAEHPHLSCDLAQVSDLTPLHHSSSMRDQNSYLNARQASKAKDADALNLPLLLNFQKWVCQAYLHRLRCPLISGAQMHRVRLYAEAEIVTHRQVVILLVVLRESRCVTDCFLLRWKSSRLRALLRRSRPLQARHFHSLGKLSPWAAVLRRRC